MSTSSAAPIESNEGARLAREHGVLLTLARSASLVMGDLPSAYREITEAAVRTLEVARASIWFYDAARSGIRCAELFEGASGVHSEGTVLAAAHYPAYFRSLEEERVIDAADAHRDPRTAEFSVGYLTPSGIGAMLDAPIRLGGRMIGVLCSEHVGGARIWSADDQRFASSLADMISLAIEASERRQTEAALEESEARYRQLVEAAPDVIFTIALDGNITSFNSAFETLTGYPREEFVGRPFSAPLVADDLPLAAEVWGRVLRGEHPPPAELRVRTRTRGIVVIQSRVVPILREGRVSTVLGIARDITAQKAVSEALHQREAHFRALIEHGQDLVVVLTGAGHVGYASPSHRSVLGLDPETLVGRAFAEHVHAEDLGCFTSSLRQILEAPGTVVPVSVRVRHHGGEWRQLEGTAINLLAHPAVAGVVVNMRDVTERQRAEARLQALTDVLKEEAETKAALVRVGREVISEVATPLLLERVCELTTELVGCDVSHAFLWDPDRQAFMIIAGHGDWAEPIDALRHVPVPRDLLAPVLEGIMEDDFTVIDWRARAETPLGRFVLARGAHVMMYAALRRRGELVGFLSAAYRHRDARFSERQQRLLRGLAQTSALGLQNAHLVEELERASRVKDDFVATMSHELRTPLNVIIGYTEMLLDRAFGPLTMEQHETLGRVALRSRELLELVQSVLDLSRLESGRGNLDLQLTDLAALAAQVENATRPVAQNPEVVYRWEVAADVGAIVTDAAKLKVVLKNLITNALKFTERGHVTVQVRGGDDGVVFAVSDSGIGIDPEGLRVIFEPFRQVSGSPRYNAAGVGLGLHIVRRLLGLLGGEIAVESAVGKGSTFRVSLPALPGQGPGTVAPSRT